MNDIIRAGARFLFGNLVPRLPYPVLRGPLRGARFVLGTLAGEGGGATVYFNMVEPEQTSAFVGSLKEGNIFFDIGANVGYYTILGARLVRPGGRVFAFEPMVRNLSYLYRHVELNGTTNVTIIPAACSDSLSLAVFSSGANPAEGHLNDGVLSPGNEAIHSPIATITVDIVAERFGIAPHVMKIDVEGAELSVLRGADKTIRSAKPQIFLSTHSNELRSACLEFLKHRGYAFTPLSNDKNNPTEFLAKFTKN